MANLRRPLRPQHRLSPIAASRRRAPALWPWAVGAAALGLLTLTWIDGGEEPLRPIAASVELPEPSQ